eukprot:Selendium_serpulae@DN3225_c0_g1_i1.p1
MIRTATLTLTALASLLACANGQMEGPKNHSKNFIHSVEFGKCPDDAINKKVTVGAAMNAVVAQEFRLQYWTTTTSTVNDEEFTFTPNPALPSGHMEFFSATTTTDFHDDGGVYLLNSLGVVVSCVHWGVLNPNAPSVVCDDAAGVFSTGLYYRLTTPASAEYKGERRGDYNTTVTQGADAVCLSTDISAQNKFAGANDATAFVNEIIYNVTCYAYGDVETGYEVAGFGRGDYVLHVGNGATGIPYDSYATFSLKPANQWNFKFIRKIDLVDSPASLDLSSGYAILFKADTFEVLSSITWGPDARDLVTVDMSVSSGALNLATHDFYPIHVSSDAAVRLHVTGLDMETKDMGTWFAHKGDRCTPEAVNSDQSFAVSSDPSTTLFPEESTSTEPATPATGNGQGIKAISLTGITALCVLAMA